MLPSNCELHPATISEAGSSLLYPLFQLWASNFTKLYPTIQLNTAAGGSGTGQSEAEHGLIQIGGSDAYLTNTQEAQFPYMLNIPVAISAQQIDYNIPGIPQSLHLNFSGPLLASIYNGTVSYWDDPAIKAINPGAASLLPHQLITPIHRSDSSGDTFIFTQYLSFSDPHWNRTVGFGTAVSWPNNPAATSANGNSGMVTACQQKQYSIAYIGVSYLKSAIAAGEGYGYLENRAGNFVNISSSNIQADVNGFQGSIPADERLSLVYGPGTNSYPIVNFEYAIVAKNQTSQAVAIDVQALLLWAILPNYGNSPYFLNQVGFVPLPSPVIQLSEMQIAEIKG